MAVNPSSASLGTDGKTVTLTFTTLALDTADTLDIRLAASITDKLMGVRPPPCCARMGHPLLTSFGDVFIPEHSATNGSARSECIPPRRIAGLLSSISTPEDVQQLLRIDRTAGDNAYGAATLFLRRGQRSRDRQRA